MKNKRLSPLVITIVIILVIVAVYGVSVYTRKHEAKDADTRNLTEMPVNRDGKLK